MVAEKKRKMGVHPVWAEKASSFDSRSHTHTGGERLNKHSNSSVGSENYQLEIYSQFIFVQKEKRLEGSPSVAPRSGPLIWLISWRVKTYRTLEIVRKKNEEKEKRETLRWQVQLSLRWLLGLPENGDPDRSPRFAEAAGRSDQGRYQTKAQRMSGHDHATS